MLDTHQATSCIIKLLLHRLIETLYSWIKPQFFNGCRIRGITFFALGADDKTINILDVSSGLIKLKLESENKARSGWIWNLVYSPDGLTLASSSYGNVIRLWDVNSGKLKSTLNDYAKTIAFSPDGLMLASGGDREIKLWDISGAKPEVIFKQRY